MSTVEKLFLQIFEQKNWIIEQAKRQTELYNHHLASKLLVDGIVPPTWLWKPTLSFGSKDLNKEELISQLLCPKPSLHYGPTPYGPNHDQVITEDNQDIFMGAGNASPSRHDDVALAATSNSDHGECVLNCIPKPFLNGMSPEIQADDSFLNFQNASDNSLARIQRSKSRQKALKLRNSASVLCKSALVHEDASEVLPGGISLSMSSTEQADHKDDLPDLENLRSICRQSKEVFDLDELNSSVKAINNDIFSGRNVRSRNISPCHGKPNESGSTYISDSEPEDYYAIKLNSDGPASVFCQNETNKMLNDSGCNRKDKEVSVCITSDVGNHHSVSRGSVQKCRVPNEELGCLKFSSELIDRVTKSKPFCNDLEIPEPLNYSQISCHGMDSRSPVKKSCDEVQNISGCKIIPPCCETQGIAGEDGSPASCMAVDSQLCNHVDLSVCSSSDVGEQRRKLAALVSQPDVYAFVGRKQLDFNVVIECNSKNLTSSPANQWSNSFPETTSNIAENLEEETPCGVNQSPEKSEFSDGGKEFNRSSFQCEVQEYHDTWDEKYVSVKSEHMMSKCSQENMRSGIIRQTYEVQDMVDLTPNLQFDQVKPSLEHGHASFSGKHDQKENFIVEDRVEDSVVSHAPGSKKIWQPCFLNSAENLGRMGTSNPICVNLNKIMQYPEHESEILSCINGDVSSQYAGFPVEKSDLIIISKGTKHGEELVLKRQFGFCNTESQSQSKRRKIQNTQIFTSYPSLEKHTDSIQIGSPGSYSKNIEVDANAILLNSVGTQKITDVGSDDKDENHSPKDLNYTSELPQVKQSPVLMDNQPSRCLNFSSESENLELVAEYMPVFESFIADSQNDAEVNLAAYDIDFSKLSRTRAALDRASILAEICRSASMDTPLSNFSSSEVQFRSLPNGNLEHLDLWTSLPFKVDVDKQLGSCESPVNGMEPVLERMSYSDCLPYCGTQYDWTTRIQLASPVGKLRERLSSQDESSEKCSSSNLDLMCFPIEEDPSVSEDSEIVNEITDDVGKETVSFPDCNTRQLLKDLTNTGGNSFVPVSVQHDIMRKDGMNIVRPNYNIYGTRDEIQGKLNPKTQSQREKQTSSMVNMEIIENLVSPIGVDKNKRAKCSINNSIRKSRLSGKTSSKRQMQNLALKGSKHNNIVSNINSFIPLVQKTQAANVSAGKREVKVKALEAAEAAKRLEEKIVNERNKRKEALKFERAKMEVENLRKIDLDKKKKEEERKKKDAEIIAKKRLRDEEDRKEKERKRMRLEAKQKQREQGENVRAEKVDKRKQQTKNDEKINSKDSCGEFKKEQNQRIWKGRDVASNKTETRLIPAGIDRSQVRCDTSGAGKEISSVCKLPQNEDLTMQRMSYEISPYRSDNENDEDQEPRPSKKYTPWARVLTVDLLVPLLQEMNPDEIFPPESFCSIDEVVRPCTLKQKHIDA